MDTAKDGEEGLLRFDALRHEIVITDVRLPGSIDGLEVVKQVKDKRPETLVIVITAFGTVETAVEAMRRGAFDFITKPLDLNVIRHQVRKASEHQRLAAENRVLRERLLVAGEDIDIVGNSPIVQSLFRQIRQVADTDATVLIQGESGTGKELIAQAIHRLSPRSQQPFVTVNLGAFPDTLLESELFGYEKGAFTGAARRKSGCFETAHHGTLFLDEITETAPKTQIDLLRVLEQRQVRRRGAKNLSPLTCASSRPPTAKSTRRYAKGEFREDWYYRLNVIPCCS